MNGKNRSNGARIGALAVSVAITIAAAVGLTAASESQGSRRADAQSQRGAATDSGSASLPTGAPNDDPELMRIDRANDHHG